MANQIDTKNVYAVIMAGGIGTRFWPKSTLSKPKQYLSLIDEKTLIQSTIDRFAGFIENNNIYIVTTRQQKNLLKEQISWINESNIFFEPCGRNTAPAIGLSAIFLQEINPDALMIIAPADHRITHIKKFVSSLKKALKLVQMEPDVLATFGIIPTYPATGYGYIQTGDQFTLPGVYKVKRFTEKPHYKSAKNFIKRKTYLWNSGLFVWKAQTILENIKSHMPNLYDGLMKIKNSSKREKNKNINSLYNNIKGQSIDYGVMEKATNAFVIEGNFGWNDLGSWQEVYQFSEKDSHGNVIKGKAVLKDVYNSYIETGDRIVSLIGVKDIVVVDTENALLICRMDHSQDVRWIVKEIEERKKR